MDEEPPALRKETGDNDSDKRVVQHHRRAGCSFTEAMRRTPPPVPPALLRRLLSKDVPGVGKVKVLLRVNAPPEGNADSSSILGVDRRRKQVSLFHPISSEGAPPPPEDRRLAVSAPKMFAFDAIFSQDDSQGEVSSAALADIVHAVVNGSDGCVFSFGHPRLGKTHTMLGTAESANTLGVVPCAISWLFRAIGEQKQRTGARFSVRVSAIEVLGSITDLLAGFTNEAGAASGEPTPGSLLSDDPPLSELRAPTAERAAFYLDAALTGRRSPSSVLVYRLHVYQYQGRAASAGRSRLHLIDLGNSKTQQGDIPLSGLGNVLLAIINGQRHLPHRDHKLTQLLKECLGSLTCHATMIAHVSQSPNNYTETLATLQLASRVHRLRRLKIKFGCSSESSGGAGVLNHHLQAVASQENDHSTGSSDVDPSSSEQSADTVIYLGPAADDATDGEHPPVYLPGLGTIKQRTPIPRPGAGKSVSAPQSAKSSPARTVTRSPSKAGTTSSASPSGVRKTSKSASTNDAGTCNASDEHWIDGPRISRSKIEEVRSLMKNSYMKKESWIDGPLQGKQACGGSLACIYGFMDNQKKKMVKKWVESQVVQSLKHSAQATKPQKTESPNPVIVNKDPEALENCYKASEYLAETMSIDYKMEPQFADTRCASVCSIERTTAVAEARDVVTENKANGKLPGMKHSENLKASFSVTDMTVGSCTNANKLSDRTVPGETKSDFTEIKRPSELSDFLQMYSSKSMSLGAAVADEGLRILEDGSEECRPGSASGESFSGSDILELEETAEIVSMQDSCLQVSEEDIALCMAQADQTPDGTFSVDEHPLRMLSNENLSTTSSFTDSLSAATEPIVRYRSSITYPQQPRPNSIHEEKPDTSSENRLEQLARLHEMYKKKLASVWLSNASDSSTLKSPTAQHPAELETWRHTSRFQSMSLSDVGDDYSYASSTAYVDGSIYSEPVINYSRNKVCDKCKMGYVRNSNNNLWYQPMFMSESGATLESRKCYHKNCNNLSESSYNIACLRRPDGSSNPDLKEEVDRNVRGMGVWGLLDLPDIKFSSRSRGFRLETREVKEEGGEEVAVPPPLEPPSRLYRRLLGKVSSRLPSASRLGSRPPQEQKDCAQTKTDSPAVVVLQYCREDVARLERRWTEVRAGKVRQLKSQQAELRVELAEAKQRLMVPASRWDFELHVEANMDHREPGFVEALQRETEILAKRVAAVKSRIMMVTCFDAIPQSGAA